MSVSDEAHIVVEKLGRSFPSPDGTTLQVLEDLSFDVPRGGLVSIVGPSGCGKSTLLNLVAGIDTPTTGEVRTDGAVGFVFQTPRLLDWRTVRHNVELLLEELELSKPDRRARVERYLELVGLDGYQDYFPHQISGGMQQRVAMARALAIHPSILVMDEPFSGLDAITAERMREELVRIWQETKKTVLFVTHDIGEAVFLSQRVFILTNQPARVHASVAVDGSRTNASSRKAKSSDVFFSQWKDRFARARKRCWCRAACYCRRHVLLARV